VAGFGHARPCSGTHGKRETDRDREDVTRLLAAAGEGDEQAASKLLPLVYERLRGLAHRQMAGESPGQTLQPTALVHEAYLRLVGDDRTRWRDRRHFFAAAAEAMRRILIDQARKSGAARHGGGRKRAPLGEVPIECDLESEDLIALDEAVRRLADMDREAHELVMLRFFGGLQVDQIAEMLEVSPSSVDRRWRTVRIWLYEQIKDAGTRSPRESAS
jgi:RNA polymerase sigma factor (TIGR02999 family)